MELIDDATNTLGMQNALERKTRYLGIRFLLACFKKSLPARSGRGNYLSTGFLQPFRVQLLRTHGNCRE